MSTKNGLPWTLQYGQCGVQGKRLYLPSPLLSNIATVDTDTVNAMVSEWITYKYGVFEEQPLSDNTTSNCSSEALLCPVEGYNSDAVTKQNLLCNGRSKRQVMMALDGHEVVRNGSDIFEPPSFSYVVRPAKKLFVIVLERAFPTEVKETRGLTWEVVQNAFFHFISSLPSNSELAIITYGVEASVNLSPTRLSDYNRAALHAKIPRRPLDSRSACSECAVKLASSLATLKSELDTSVVLLTRSGVSESTLNLLGHVSMTTVVGLHRLSMLSDQVATYVVSQCDSRQTCRSSVSHVLNTVLRDHGRPREHFHHRQFPESGDLIKSGHFLLEESLSSELTVVATANDERDIASLELTSPLGNKHTFPEYEFGMAYFKLKDSEPGQWTYTVRMYSNSDPVSVDAYAEPKSSDATVQLKAWTLSQIDPKHHHPVVYLYAQVSTQVLSPINNATVVAVISRPGQNLPLVEVPLYDNGLGYPDVTMGDGIYSAYFVQFAPESGHYHVTIVAKSKSNTVPPFERRTAANSFYVEQMATSFYVRKDAGSDLLVNDVFPPSRIADLTSDGHLGDHQLFVTLKWTAPGGDYDRGSAFRYEIRCATNREALRDDAFAELSIPVHASLIPAPESYGTVQRCTVGVPWHNQMFYYAIVAFDAAGNRAQISNTVQVRIEEEEEDTTTLYYNANMDENEVMSSPRQSQKENNGPIEAATSDNHFLIWATVATAVVICGLLSGLVFVYYRTSLCRRRTYKCDDSNVSNVTETSSQGVSCAPEKDPDVIAVSNGSYITSNKMPAPQQVLPDDLSLEQKIDLWAWTANQELEPRIHVLEDCSVYRDLSTLGDASSDYFRLDRLLSALVSSSSNNMGFDTLKRHESLV